MAPTPTPNPTMTPTPTPSPTTPTTATMPKTTTPTTATPTTTTPTTETPTTATPTTATLTTTTSATAKKKRTRSKYMGHQTLQKLLKQSQQALSDGKKDLQEINSFLIGKDGHTPLMLVDTTSTLLDHTFRTAFHNTFVLETTGGYSNTDHEVKNQGKASDRLTELIGAYQRRNPIQQRRRRRCEDTSILDPRYGSSNANQEMRWDKPKLPGERRRKLKRDPNAPMEPPPSAYTVFLAQWTYKLRSENPDVVYHQSMVTPKVSLLWKTMDENERAYYLEFLEDYRKEYQQLLLEYRATGTFDASKSEFGRLPNKGPWVRRNVICKNALELELMQYKEKPKESPEGAKDGGPDDAEKKSATDPAAQPEKDNQQVGAPATDTTVLAKNETTRPNHGNHGELEHVQTIAI